MFSEELRNEILADIGKSDVLELTSIQKQNKRLLKMILYDGIEAPFVNGVIKLKNYQSAVGSMMTLFNAYHSGYRYNYIGLNRRKKATKYVLERLPIVGTIGVTLEGGIKIWELLKLQKVFAYLVKNSKINANSNELLRYFNPDIEESMCLYAPIEEYTGMVSMKRQREINRMTLAEQEKVPSSSSSSSSSSQDNN